MPVYVLPLIVRVTVSPACVPVVEPVIVTLLPASAALTTLSVVTLLTEMVRAGAVVSTV